MEQLELFGTIGEDSLTGTDSSDTLYGGGTLLVPGDAADTLSGGAGDDALYGNGGNDSLLGEGDNDTLYGGVGNDTLYGGGAYSDTTDGADWLYGQDGADVLYGNGGNDTLIGGDNADTLYGGFGNDSMRGGNLYDSLGDGGDLIIAGPGSDTVQGSEGNDTLYGGMAVSDVTDAADVIEGGAGDDIIYGNGGADSLVGGAGADTLYGGFGVDTLEGGDGVDLIVGGTEDIIRGGAGIDRFVLNAEEFLQAMASPSAQTINGGETLQALQVLDLEQGESIQLVGVDSSRDTQVTTDADTGKTIITIDGNHFAQLNGVAVSDVSALTQNSASNTVDIALGDAPGSSAGPGDPTIYGTINADTLMGGTGDDIFVAKTGVDNISAGAGNDNITIADWNAVTLPTAVSPGNLQLWLDASDATTITESGGAVSQWNDKSGNANHAAQSTKTSQPEYIRDINGRSALDFNSDFLGLGGFTNPVSNYTFFVATNSTATSIAGRYLFDTNVGRLVLGQTGNNGLGNVDYFDGATWHNIAPPIAGNQLLAWHLDNVAGGTIYRDGATLGNSTYTQKAIGGGASIGNSVGGGGVYFEGSIGEFIIFNDALSDSDRNTIERYLSNKYGIELDASVANTNDVIDGGTGTDTLTISSGAFMLNPGTLSTFNSIETFNLSGNDASHEITLTDAYYDTNGGVESDLVTVNLSGNNTGAHIDGATLTGTHAVSVQGSNGADTVIGGAATSDHLDYSARSTAVTVNQTLANFGGLDSITGGAAGDTISGGLGNQTLTGGDGADRLFGDVDVGSFDVAAAIGGSNKLWLDASDASTITHAGGAVSQWNDKSGNANHASNAVLAGQPLWNQAANGGAGSVYFDGSDSLSGANLLNGTTGRTVIAIARPDAVPFSNTNAVFELNNTNAGFGTHYGLYLEGLAGTNGTSLRVRGYKTFNVEASITDLNLMTVSTDDNQNVTDSLLHFNGQGIVGTAQSAAAINTAAGNYSVGYSANSGGSYFLTGEVNELLVFDTALSTSQRQQVETYLAEKWGIDYAGVVQDADNLSGGAGDDILAGGVGNDTLDGGADNDTLEGGQDNDQLTGGTGNDVFIFKNTSGQDTITDFGVPGAGVGDLIHLLTNINGNVITNFAQLAPNISQNGANTVIDLDPGNPGTHTITINNTTAADFIAADFVFI